MEKDNPQKKFTPANTAAECEFMKMTTLEKVLWSLEDMRYKVKVPKKIAQRARLAIDRMVSINAN